MNIDAEALTQNKDGKWVPATPCPFYVDSRPWYIVLKHVFQACGAFLIWDGKKQEAYIDRLEVEMDKYLVPQK